MISDQSRLTIVIGASRGIGRHLTQRAIARGDDVLACARTTDDLPTHRPERAENLGVFAVVAGDFLHPEADLSLVLTAINRHEGPVSIFVTAATIGPVGPLTAIDLSEWAHAIDANVGGPARILAATIPHLRPDDLVVVFSGGGVGGPHPQPNVSAYTTSKAALVHLIDVTSRENSACPVLVAVAPGAFPTGFVDPVLAADPQVAGTQLLADVTRTKQGRFDTTDLDALLDHLETADVRWLSGRCISARRDNPAVLDAIPDKDRESPDLFRLRRVDGVGVVVHEW